MTAPNTGDSGGIDIDLLMASLRADGVDARAYLQALAAKLDGALPGQVKVERRGGLLGRDRGVRRIEVDLGSARYEVADAGHGRLEARRATVVRGVTLKTESLPVAAWIAGLATDLAAQAEGSGRAREALERLLLS